MRKRISILIVFILALTLVTGCNSSHPFVGESEHWKGTLYTKLNSNNEVTEDGTLEYTGDNKKIINRVKYKIKGMYGAHSGDRGIKNGKIRIHNECERCSMQSRSMPYEVVIEWNGKKEIFQLKSH
jgi:hypothetical protein